MRFAAIDVGSNSVHMVIADVQRDGYFEVIDQTKEMVRLGRHAFSSGRLERPAMNLAIRALRNFVRLARVRRVERIRAVATSAVREARNRDAFIERIRRETGLRVAVISGAEEARLIFSAARHALGLEGGPHLLVDVGGGSVELVLVRDGEPLWMVSLPLGVARISEEFLRSDPPTEGQVRRLEEHLEEQLSGPLRKARRAQVVNAIGTSGTINAMVSMAYAARGEEPERLHGLSASAAEVAALRRQIVATPMAQRADLAGADAKRVDLIPAAAILADHVLQHSGAPRLIACTWALREGLLLSMAGEPHANGRERTRRRSVRALARRFGALDDHGRQVSRLSLKIFDETAEALELDEPARELLEHAAILHDVGHAIHHHRHNRHTYYLIKSAELLGFSPLEIEVIAQAARAHRKQAARLDSPEFRALSPSKRHTVRGLAAILRLADALDRSHFGVVKDMNISCSAGRLAVAVDSGSGQADLELWTCETRTDLLSKLLNRTVTVRPLRRRASRRTPSTPRTAGNRVKAAHR